ncbi:MAG: OmpA family protein [Gammaproteobacteria bacterium]
MKPAYFSLAIVTALLLPGTALAAGAADALAFPPGLEALATDSLAPAPPQLELISVNHIFFEYDKAELSDRAKHILDAVARHITHHSMVGRVIIRGHTDEVATVAYNYRLADRRVAAVGNYLSAQGVPEALLYSAGLGEQRPIDESWTREGRRRNRHVEIYIIQYLASSDF